MSQSGQPFVIKDGPYTYVLCECFCWRRCVDYFDETYLSVEAVEQCLYSGLKANVTLWEFLCLLRSPKIGAHEHIKWSLVTI
jgi:hypothetical protein